MVINLAQVGRGLSAELKLTRSLSPVCVSSL